MATVIVSDDEEQCEIPPETVKKSATDISVEMLFACGVYRSHDEKYLDIINPIFKRAIAERKKEVPDFLKGVYPTIMTRDLAREPKLEELLIEAMKHERINQDKKDKKVLEILQFKD